MKKAGGSDIAIRTVVTEMNELIAEKNRNRDRIRALLGRVKRDLHMASGDFVLATKLAAKAQKSEKSAAATLNTVRRVFLALGRTIPVTVIEASTGATRSLGPIKSEIFDALKAHAPASTSELRRADKSLASLTSLGTHLSQMLAAKVVTRLGDGRWTLPAPTQ